MDHPATGWSSRMTRGRATSRDACTFVSSLSEDGFFSIVCGCREARRTRQPLRGRPIGSGESEPEKRDGMGGEYIRTA